MTKWPDIGTAARMANDLKRARDAMLGARTPLDQSPVLELRLHPDDLAELRRMFGPWFSGERINGVPVIADRSAERLPKVAA